MSTLSGLISGERDAGVLLSQPRDKQTRGGNLDLGFGLGHAIGSKTVTSDVNPDKCVCSA